MAFFLKEQQHFFAYLNSCNLSQNCSLFLQFFSQRKYFFKSLHWMGDFCPVAIDELQMKKVKRGSLPLRLVKWHRFLYVEMCTQVKNSSFFV
jgi:hypothetical protein